MGWDGAGYIGEEASGDRDHGSPPSGDLAGRKHPITLHGPQTLANRCRNFCDVDLISIIWPHRSIALRHILESFILALALIARSYQGVGGTWHGRPEHKLGSMVRAWI